MIQISGCSSKNTHEKPTNFRYREPLIVGVLTGRGVHPWVGKSSTGRGKATQLCYGIVSCFMDNSMGNFDVADVRIRWNINVMETMHGVLTESLLTCCRSSFN